jgi:release factor glutamine methyltransferase
MKFKAIRDVFHKELATLFSSSEIDSFLYKLIEDYCGYNRLFLALKPDEVIAKAEELRLIDALVQLKKEKPIQQILGKTHFYNLEFEINEHILIPRPETEELVDWIVSDLKLKNSEVQNSNSKLQIPNLESQISNFQTQNLNSESSCLEQQPIKILDIGTGSGCIAIALAKYIPNAAVFAMDISDEALKMAEKNAERHNVKITFIKADILNLQRIEEEFTIIVSNPPYVRLSEKNQMKNNVLNYEPHIALFVPDENPLLFYEKISLWALEHLKENGLLYFEINQYLGKTIVELLKANGFCNTALRKDIYGNDRILRGIKTKVRKQIIDNRSQISELRNLNPEN